MEIRWTAAPHSAAAPAPPRPFDPSLMFTLVIGDKNLSSWSLRPWLVLRALGFEFREVKLTLDTPEFRRPDQPVLRRAARSRAARRRRCASGTRWRSSIPQRAARAAAGPPILRLRALARCVSAEMHSGFPALRQTLEHALHWHQPERSTGADGRPTWRASSSIWEGLPHRPAALGPWLFGDWCIADAMYAPVVLRFRHYGARRSSRSLRPSWRSSPAAMAARRGTGGRLELIGAGATDSYGSDARRGRAAAASHVQSAPYKAGPAG